VQEKQANSKMQGPKYTSHNGASVSKNVGQYKIIECSGVKPISNFTVCGVVLNRAGRFVSGVNVIVT
jgi:hypothetical protein